MGPWLFDVPVADVGIGAFAARLAVRAETADLDALIASGHVIAEPITYEDFLPVSAAGIFQSNLGAGSQQEYQSGGNRAAFEAALGAPVLDEMALYERQQRESLDAALAALGRPA